MVQQTWIQQVQAIQGDRSVIGKVWQRGFAEQCWGEVGAKIRGSGRPAASSLGHTRARIIATVGKERTARRRNLHSQATQKATEQVGKQPAGVGRHASAHNCLASLVACLAPPTPPKKNPYPNPYTHSTSL